MKITMETFENVTTIINRDGKQKGTLTGGKHICPMAGCTGVRLSAKWADGHYTFPCTKGLDIVKHGKGYAYKII